MVFDVGVVLVVFVVGRSGLVAGAVLVDGGGGAG